MHVPLESYQYIQGATLRRPHQVNSWYPTFPKKRKGTRAQFSAGWYKDKVSKVLSQPSPTNPYLSLEVIKKIQMGQTNYPLLVHSKENTSRENIILNGYNSPAVGYFMGKQREIWNFVGIIERWIGTIHVFALAFDPSGGNGASWLMPSIKECR